jgi:hypothetical protein
MRRAGFTLSPSLSELFHELLETLAARARPIVLAGRQGSQGHLLFQDTMQQGNRIKSFPLELQSFLHLGWDGRMSDEPLTFR